MLPFNSACAELGVVLSLGGNPAKTSSTFTPSPSSSLSSLLNTPQGTPLSLLVLWVLLPGGLPLLLQVLVSFKQPFSEYYPWTSCMGKHPVHLEGSGTPPQTHGIGFSGPWNLHFNKLSPHFVCIWELRSSCSMASEVAQNFLSESPPTFPPSLIALAFP